MIIDPASARALALVTIALWLKAMAMSTVQVVVRIRSRSVTRSEDARLMRIPVSAREHPLVDSLGDAWRNETEATPIFLALSGAYVILGGASVAFGLILLTYVAMRWVHGLMQATSSQPGRTLAWLGGVAATIAVTVLLLIQIAG